MVAVLNGVVGGAGIALLVAWLQGGFSRGFILPIAVGTLVGLALIAVFLVYQDRRYAALTPTLREWRDG